MFKFDCMTRPRGDYSCLGKKKIKYILLCKVPCFDAVQVHELYEQTSRNLGLNYTVCPA